MDNEHTQRRFERYATLERARDRCKQIDTSRHAHPTFTGIYRGHRDWVVQITEIGSDNEVAK